MFNYIVLTIATINNFYVINKNYFVSSSKWFLFNILALYKLSFIPSFEYYSHILHMYIINKGYICVYVLSMQIFFNY